MTGNCLRVLLTLAFAYGCGQAFAEGQPTVPAPTPDLQRPAATEASQTRPARDYRLVHVFVALCDNRNQGIAPVPVKLGNGQDPAGNLYWGAAYDVRTFLARSKRWEEVSLAGNPRRPEILARTLFVSRGTARRCASSLRPTTAPK